MTKNQFKQLCKERGLLVVSVRVNRRGDYRAFLYRYVYGGNIVEFDDSHPHRVLIISTKSGDERIVDVVPIDDLKGRAVHQK